MNPGATTSPEASTVSSPRKAFSEISTIRSPRMPTLRIASRAALGVHHTAAQQDNVMSLRGLAEGLGVERQGPGQQCCQGNKECELSVHHDPASFFDYPLLQGTS